MDKVERTLIEVCRLMSFNGDLIEPFDGTSADVAR